MSTRSAGIRLIKWLKVWTGYSRASTPSPAENRCRWSRTTHWCWSLVTSVCCAALALGQDWQLSERGLNDIAPLHGDAARHRVVEWRQLIATKKGLSERDKLTVVNHFFNQLNFTSDLAHWHRQDYWATPLETLVTNGGDCEDFSIAKYFTLKELGVTEQRLRLTYVKALRLNQAHMVVTYYATPGADPLVLDNLVTRILPASRRPDLYPVYSFNGVGLWLAKARGGGQPIGDSTRLGLWRDLLERMRKENGE